MEILFFLSGIVMGGSVAMMVCQSRVAAARRAGEFWCLNFIRLLRAVAEDHARRAVGNADERQRNDPADWWKLN